MLPLSAQEVAQDCRHDRDVETVWAGGDPLREGAAESEPEVRRVAPRHPLSLRLSTGRQHARLPHHSSQGEPGSAVVGRSTCALFLHVYTCIFDVTLVFSALQYRSDLENHVVDAATTSEAVGFITLMQELKRKLRSWEQQVEVYIIMYYTPHGCIHVAAHRAVGTCTSALVSVVL